VKTDTCAPKTDLANLKKKTDLAGIKGIIDVKELTKHIWFKFDFLYVHAKVRNQYR
jgi:hypothetical protein